MSSPAEYSINNQGNLTMLFGKKKQGVPQTGISQETQPKPKPKKLIGLTVAKYEVTEEKVKFFNSKGLFKKSWVVEKEFPLYEITSVECLGNWISLTWNNAQYQFLLKRKGESFVNLKEQIQTLQLEHQTNRELNTKLSQQKIDLQNLINGLFSMVDTSFDILIALNVKRVNWFQIEAIAKNLGASFSYKPSTLPQLDLDFSKIDTTIKGQNIKETSKETFSVLKMMHDYFTGLTPENNAPTFKTNIEHAKSILLAYYTINDLLLAKVVGEKDNKKEVSYLEEVTKPLSEIAIVNFDLASILERLDTVVPNTELEGAVSDMRLLFREQLKQL